MIDETQEVYNRGLVLPDSFTELVINCGAPMSFQRGDSAPVELPRVFFAQLQTSPMRFRVEGQAQFISVGLYPWTAHALFGLPMPEQEMFVPLDQKWDRLADSVQAVVRHHGYTEALARLQEFMLGIYARSEKSEVMLVREAGEQLYAANGLLEIEQLANNTGLSLRQLERRFKQMTGVNPKWLARLIRFESVRNRLFRNPSAPILDLVHEFGYTDQAHLTHEFKTFTQMTPGRFIAHNGKYPHMIEEVEFLQYA
jgi:AraC-like DNA-binding protein